MKVAIFLFFIFLLAGLVALCVGVYVLAGYGWSLIAVAVCLLLLAALSSAAISRIFGRGSS